MNPVNRSFHLAAFLIGTLIVFAASFGGLQRLFQLAIADERYTHTLLTPFLALGLLFRLRAEILSTASWARPSLGALAIGAAAAMAIWFLPGPSFEPAGAVFGVVFLFWICFGTHNLWRARFPVLILALAIPWPESLVAHFETFLQHASAETTHQIFRLTGTPFHREGLQFALPGVVIEVARECSGIRSTNALILTTLVLAHLFLRSPWRMAVLLLVVLPVTILKNAIRIASLSWLGIYVSRDFLTGDLHQQGGILFAGIGLLLIAPILFWLARGERPTP